MSIWSRIASNLIAFVVGAVLTCGVILFMNYSVPLTASVGDIIKTTKNDVLDMHISVIEDLDMLSFSLSHEFDFDSTDSLRFEFIYDTKALDQIIINSLYPYSISSEDEIMTIIITPGNATISQHDLLFTLSLHSGDNRLIPILQGSYLYADELIEPLRFVYTGKVFH